MLSFSGKIIIMNWYSAENLEIFSIERLKWCWLDTKRETDGITNCMEENVGHWMASWMLNAKANIFYTKNE